jgi:NAD(P)-dependent dehydrogenase (short-subunit alcohol dehydrogenase family)
VRSRWVLWESGVTLSYQVRLLYPTFLPQHANSSCVGTIETPINEEDLADEEKRAYMTKRIPLGRLGVPDDIAEPVCFMASDMAKYSMSRRSQGSDSEPPLTVFVL